MNETHQIHEFEPEYEKDSKILILGSWDVIESCDITGSSDSSIRNVVPNNIKFILENTKVNRIYANAAFSLERLKEAWKQITVE